MSTRTKEDAEKNLPDNLIYSEYNGYSKRSNITCKKCDHVWQITPKNATKRTSCPNCKKIGIPQIYQKRVPENIRIENFVNIYTRASYYCTKCDHIGFVTFRYLRNEIVCKNCKNTGVTKTDIKNELLKQVTNSAVEFVEFKGTKEDSTLVCKLCNNKWMAKIWLISSDITCPSCKYQFINEESFKNLISSIEMKCYVLPQNRKSKFLATCNFCKTDTMLSIKDIEKGKACDDCENKHPSQNQKRCRDFAELKKDYLELEVSIEFVKLDEKTSEKEWRKYNGSNCDISTYRWRCIKSGHMITGKLSFIKNLFFKYGNEKWCPDCRGTVSYFHMKNKAEQLGWTMVIGKKDEKKEDEEDFILSAFERYTWICENGHIFHETYLDFDKRNRCELCPDKLMKRVIKNVIKRMEEEDKLKRISMKQIDIEVNNQEEKIVKEQPIIEVVEEKSETPKLTVELKIIEPVEVDIIKVPTKIVIDRIPIVKKKQQKVETVVKLEIDKVEDINVQPKKKRVFKIVEQR